MAAIFQNVAGILVAKFFGMNHLVGIIGGSISMMGGLGTAGTFGVLFENTFGVNVAVVAGVTCATFGMIACSVLGGPLSEWIIKKHKIITPHTELTVSLKIIPVTSPPNMKKLPLMHRKRVLFLLILKKRSRMLLVALI
ncbi:hypothetical protein AGMMS49921_08600 [Endomicrobiia bacterium]|nr:hypothetical protein AGMMS49921_08600 [Endomicrobiia bacterium]